MGFEDAVDGEGVPVDGEELELDLSGVPREGAEDGGDLVDGFAREGRGCWRKKVGFGRIRKCSKEAVAGTGDSAVDGRGRHRRVLEESGRAFQVPEAME